MFNKQLKAENARLQERVEYLESLMAKEGHVHNFVETNRRLINGFEASNGMPSEYMVTKVCSDCGKEETKMSRGI